SAAPERLADFRDEDALVRLQWPEIARRDGPPVPAGEGVVGLVLTWKDKHITLPLLDVEEIPFFGTQYSLPAPEEMETMIDESLESLVGVNDDIGYLADHGTFSMDPAAMMRSRSQSPDESLASFRSLVEDNYTIDEVNLADEGLHGQFDCLVIARPTKKFTDYELFQIDQYLMRGGNLALFLDQFQAKYPRGQSTPYAQPSYVPIETGLKKLLSHYGVKIEDAVVMDESCYIQRAERFGGGGEQPIYFAPVIKNKNINKTPAFMSNIKGLVTMKVSPLQIDADRLAENGTRATTLFSSSDQSWTQRERVTFNPMFTRPPSAGEERQSFPLACLLEGEFPSYFAGRDIPVRKTGESEQNAAGNGDGKTAVTAADRLIEKGKPARIFVMGSSQMLADHMLDREGRFPNSIFIMNLLDSLNNRDQMAVLRSKQQAHNPIYDLSGSTKSLIKWINIAGLPVLVLLCGLVVTAIRSARKRRIRMMFAA
ncbi:MAG: Gldg family protein, partial [Desulfosudaceae bacterium]